MNGDGDSGATIGSASLSATQAEELDRACDRFEAAWRAEARPRIEDHLEGLAEPLRSALLGELIAVELDWRRRLGERPAPGEYHDRFPGHAATVASGFGPAAGPARLRAGPSPPNDPAPGLLLGLLAFQNHFIDREALLAALGAWVANKATPSGRILLDRGALDAATYALLEALTKKHLEVHDGDAEKSLAALPLGRSTREVLERVSDPDIHATLSHVGSGPSPAEFDAESTASYSIGSATAEGQRFRVLRPHAQGGLGAVFVALDSELNREVALNRILDRHADDPVSRSRFLVEAEVTGGLEHPGIVPVYGLGTYADGRPYYAMRFIRGDSLKGAIERFHADAALKADPGRSASGGLELRKLLRRFIDICNAIDYAHSRGVLHRDIKPGNIIVGKYGETLVVDWGLAKATGQSHPGTDERTLRPSSGSGSAETMPGSALGTPAYMSPEQAEGDLEHLGPRSDVYSLGATLHCLLTGRAPFTDGDIDAVLRAVRRGEFTAPRQVDPTVNRALEAVCLKTMARRPEDRYDSCRALAEEIERWMADEPVTAWREPVSVRIRRWARRNRTAVAAAAVALGAGVVGLGAVAGVQARANQRLREASYKTETALIETKKAKNATDAALAETKEAKKATDRALAQSEESRQQAEAVSAFLVDAFRSPDPEQTGRDVKVADLLDRAAKKRDQEFAGSQATKGALLNALGQTYWGLGLYDQAVSLHTKARTVREAALGPDHLDTLKSRNNLAIAYYSAGRLQGAIALHQETLKLLESKLGPDHPSTLDSRNNLANAYHGAGRLEEAIALHQETLKQRESKLGPNHPATLRSRNGLAAAYESLGQWTAAESLHRDVLARRRKTVPPDSPLLADDLTRLGENLLNQSRWSEAESLLRECLRVREKAAPDDWKRSDAMSLLGGALLGQGRYAEAEPLVVAGYEGMKARAARIPVPERSQLLAAAIRVVRLYEDWGRPDQAAAWKGKLGLPDLPADIFARP